MTLIVTPYLKRFTYFEHFELKQEIKIPFSEIEILTNESTEWLNKLSEFKLLRVLESSLFFGAPEDIISKIKELLYLKSGSRTVLIRNWRFMKYPEINISPFSWL